MKRIAFAALVAAFTMGTALAQAPAPAGDSCATKAVSKAGKPLAGAAKRSAMAKCKREACLPKAVGSGGKALRGAARISFMTKCMRETT
jgi:nicotinic acid phosphoribosyltransferase